MDVKVDVVLVPVADERTIRHHHEAALCIARRHFQILHDLEGKPLVRVAVDLTPGARLGRLVLHHDLLAENAPIHENNGFVKLR